MVRAAIAVAALALGAGLPAGSAEGRAAPLAAVELSFWTARDGLILLAPLTCGDRCRPRPSWAVTRDGGRTWRPLPKQIAAAELVAVPGTTVAYARTASALLRSDDRGASWRRVSRPRRDLFGLTFATPRVGWALVPGADNGVNYSYRILATADGGRSWRGIRNPCPSFWSTTIAVAAPTRGWALCASSPAGPWRIKALFATTDRGKSWTLRSGRTSWKQQPRGGGLSEYGASDGMVFRPSGAGWLWGTRGHFLTTRDGGRGWRPLRASHAEVVIPWSVSFATDRVGFAVIHDIRAGRLLAATRDGGDTWTTLHRWRWS